MIGLKLNSVCWYAASRDKKQLKVFSSNPDSPSLGLCDDSAIISLQAAYHSCTGTQRSTSFALMSCEIHSSNSAFMVS